MEHKIKRQRMSIYFPPDLLEQVRHSAKKNHRSFNQEVLSILDREVNKEVYQKKLQEASERAMREVELAMFTDLVDATPEEFVERRKKYPYLSKRTTQEDVREWFEKFEGLEHE